MERLSRFLRKRRNEINRPLRWVERESKKLYPDNKDAQISNGYLYQIESEKINFPHPLKLRTLAQLYDTDYYYLLQLAGYIEERKQEDIDPNLVKSFNQLTPKLQEHVIRIVDELVNVQENIREEIRSKI
ncbi:MAG TPA: helix-turn-helix domain-containing protein [Bacteroidales bacterium]|nr:helix-turn-helix domain-containing protein [Bacteroidales bacterium]